MSLTSDQEVIVAEILQESLSVVQAVTLTDEQIAWLENDIDTWEAKRDSIAVELHGDTDYRTKRLLDDIRGRVRTMYGLPLYSDQSGMGASGSSAIPNTPVF